MAFIVLPVDHSVEDTFEQGAEVIRETYPDWDPVAGDGVGILLRATAVMLTELKDLATQVGAEVFRYYGRSVERLLPIDELPATGAVTFTAAASLTVAREIREGLEVVGTSPGSGEPWGFATVAAASIEPGGTVTVDVEAVEPGEGGNGITGTGELGDYEDFLEAEITFVGTTTGGRDQEDDLDYLDRLRDLNTIYGPQVVHPEDFATMARALGAFRAVAINGLDPEDGSTGNERVVAVGPIGEDGLPDANAAGIVAQLDAMRETNFEVKLLTPEYTPIDVTAAVTTLPGRVQAEVEAAVEDALSVFLSPAQWGMPRNGEYRAWFNRPVVRRFEVAEAIMAVEGVDFITSLTIGEDGGALGTSDITLDGYAPLPEPGAFNITATVGT
jgi:hypothetical protein